MSEKGRYWVSGPQIAAGMEVCGLDEDTVRRIYQAMVAAREIPHPVRANIPSRLPGEHWRYFNGWRVRPATGWVGEDGVRRLYDIDIDASRPITESDMELAPPEAA